MTASGERLKLPLSMVMFLMICVWCVSTNFISSITMVRFLTSMNTRTLSNMFCSLSVSAKSSSSSTVSFKFFRRTGWASRVEEEKVKKVEI